MSPLFGRRSSASGREARATEHGATAVAPMAADLRAGTRIAGYELESVVGRGGMGVVYRARQLRLNRVVALKMVLAGGHAGAAARARFRAEAEAVARLRHPNVVQIYESGEHAQRVGRGSALVARELGLDEDFVEIMRWAAPLHDIGKLAIADAILLKRGKLSETEYE